MSSYCSCSPSRSWWILVKWKREELDSSGQRLISLDGQNIYIYIYAFYNSKSLSVRLCVFLFTFEVPLIRLFAPLLKVEFKSFYRIGILGEKQWKEVFSDLTTFTNKGCKIAVQSLFWENFALLSRIFWYWCFSVLLTVYCPHFPKSNGQTF